MSRPTLYPFQAEDVAAVIAAHKTHRCVLGRAATGLGKGMEIAALCDHYRQFGRVLVMVDVKKLVRQLADEIYHYTGIRPGIEMADERAFNGGTFHDADPIVVTTVQTQYSGDAGRERYRQFDPDDFACVILDECETFLAPKARQVVDWYLGNADLRVFGCSATPFRTDGTPMANLFQDVAFNRDILWGIGQGYLVPARQAFVRVSLDFSTLKLRRDDQGDSDYSAEEIADKISNEQTMIELAKGIIHVCEDRVAIVVCPTVETARAVAHYLEAERPGCARCIYGEMGDDEKDDIFGAFDRDEFQFLTSVMMLTKGFNKRNVRAVVNCRKTKSKRLYQQVLGRGTRTLRGVVEGIADADERRARIAASAKSDMLMVNMVGVDASVRDVTLVDILGTADQEPGVAERAKELVEKEGMETTQAIAKATQEVEQQQEAARQRAEKAAENQEKAIADRLERELRKRVQVDANVDVQWKDDLGADREHHGHNMDLAGTRIPQNQLEIFRKAKLTDAEVSALTPAQATALSRELVRRWKLKLCSWRQAKTLAKYGYGKAELHNMTRDQASAAMDTIKANGWRRPVEEGVAA